MKFFLIALIAVFGWPVASAQNFILHDPVSARVFDTDRYSGVRGTPFLHQDWMNGSVTTNKGVYRKLPLKFNVHENKLYFNKDDKAYEFQDEVTAFCLMPNESDSATFLRFKKGISAQSLSGDQFVQVMIEGKVSLYKSTVTLMSEVNEINSGVIKTFNTSTRYYVVSSYKTKLVRINRKDLLEFLIDKESALQEYIKSNKLSFKNEGDLVKVVAYYNDL